MGTLEKDRLVTGQKKMESRLQNGIEIRDISIAELEGSVANLRKIIVDKDRIIVEKDEQIKRYESSFRQVAKLGLVVLKNKTKKAASPLKKLIQNSPPPDDMN